MHAATATATACSDCNCEMHAATATATACSCDCQPNQKRLLTDKHIFLELPALQKATRLKPLHFHVMVVQLGNRQNARALSAAASKKKRKQKQKHDLLHMW